MDDSKRNTQRERSKESLENRLNSPLEDDKSSHWQKKDRRAERKRKEHSFDERDHKRQRVNHDRYSQSRDDKRAYHVAPRTRLLYNFEVDSTYQAKLTNLPKVLPNLEVEYQRARQIEGLRKVYRNSCLNVLQVPPPAQSFTRYLFEMLSLPQKERVTQDPVLTRPELATSSAVLRRELLNQVPASLYIPWGLRGNVSRQLSILSNYVSKALRWLKRFREEEGKAIVGTVADTDEDVDEEKKRKEKEEDVDKEKKRKEKEEAVDEEEKRSSEDEKSVEDELSALRDWLDEKHSSVTLDEVKERFNRTTSRCGEFFKAKFSPLVDEICQKVADAAVKVCEELTKTSEQDSHQASTQKFTSYVSVKYRNDSLEITRDHYEKLKKLYTIHNPEDNGSHNFDRCLYALVCRYSNLFGKDYREGSAFHAAAPEGVFKTLHREFGVAHENFASPFNCYYRHFNSAFPDVDVFFGSKGSFFDFEPIEGSFETGPPYTEEVMDNMAERLEYLLANSNLPLSFIVFVPDWQTPLAKSLEIMGNSKFLQSDFVVKGNEYSYVIGDQQSVSNYRDKNLYFALPFDTHLYILQNEAGKQKWPVTDENLEAFKKSFSLI